MAPPRKSVRLARQLASDPNARLEAAHVSPYVLRRLCELADEKFSCGDRDVLRLARLGCRIAGLLNTDEARARSFGSLVLGLCLANRPDHAAHAAATALAAAPAKLRGDLLRRKAYVHLYKGRLAEARRDAEAAVRLTVDAEHAKAQEVLGIILYYSGEYRAAIRKLGEALALTDPGSDTEFCIAIQNYATALTEGSDAEARWALQLCAELRSQLKDRHKMQRAKLRWTEGLLHKRFGDWTTARQALDVARRSLVVLQAAPEVAAIVADIALLTPQPPAVRYICSEAEKAMAAGHPLMAHLRRLQLASRETIPTAAASLRKVASSLAPCPAL